MLEAEDLPALVVLGPRDAPALARGDDAARLASRVLALEHQIYPRALRWFLNDELEFDGNRVRHRTGESQLLS